jgi:hypothetical protein
MVWGKKVTRAGLWWLPPVSLATQEAEIRRIAFQSQPRKIVVRPHLEKKKNYRKGLVEWLKV